MTLKLSLKNGKLPRVLFDEEATWEREVLASNYARSKLACKIARLTPSSIGWTINYSPGCFKVDIDEETIILPSKMTREEFCYVLRIVIDGLVILYNKELPLHGAAIADGQNALLFFALPNAGKSFFSDLVARTCNGFQVIGDDHIILSDDVIVGNAVRRMRIPGRISQSYLANCQCSQGERKSAIVIERSSKNFFGTVSRVNWLEIWESNSVLKYLSVDPIINGYQFYLRDIFGINIVDKYKNLVAAADFCSVKKVAGTFDFISETVIRENRQLCPVIANKR